MDEVAATFERSVKSGQFRLGRTWPALLATGAVGGLDVGMGVLGLLLVEHFTHSKLEGSIAFGIGFIALALAGSELFTEDFLIPVAAVVAGKSNIRSLIRLWVGTLITNLLAGWLMMWIITTGLPQLKPNALVLGIHFVKQGTTLQSFATAILAGTIITVMTWMEASSRSILARIIASVSAAFLLAMGSLNHAIVASLEIFASLQFGAPFGYLSWLEVLGWAILGNMIGGIFFVTVLRLVQVGSRKIEEEKEIMTQT